jgi:hypothetical protein
MRGRILNAGTDDCNFSVSSQAAANPAKNGTGRVWERKFLNALSFGRSSND